MHGGKISGLFSRRWPALPYPGKDSRKGSTPPNESSHLLGVNEMPDADGVRARGLAGEPG